MVWSRGRRRGGRALAAAAACFAACLSGGAALAQNLAGVPDPTVQAGAQVAEVRLGYRPRDGEPDRLGQRYQYGRALSTSVIARAYATFSGEPDDQRFEVFSGQLMVDLSEDGDRWRTGLRLDGQLRDGSLPEVARLVWSNVYALDDRLTARAVLLADVEFGDRAADGVGLETRASLSWTAPSGPTVGAEFFGLHGRTDDLDPFGGGQQAGPFVTLPVSKDWSVFTSALFGLNEVSPDVDLRLWFTRTF